MNIAQYISQILSKQVKVDFDIDFDAQVLKGKHPSVCDYYSNFPFLLSKKLRQSPVTIAEKIKKSITKDTGMTINVAKNGFFNVFLSNQMYQNILDKNHHLVSRAKEPQNINIESICANPTGYMHIGHMRNAVYAKVLKNILKFKGHNVSTIYYNNNHGHQINVCTQSVMNLFFSLDIEDPDFYKGTEIEEAARNINTNFAKEDFEIYNFTSDNFIIARKKVREYFTSEIKEDISSLDIVFDEWFNESDLYNNQEYLIKKYLEILEEKKVVYVKDNALWIQTQKYGDDKDRVLVKSDKSYTYILPDAVYHYERIQHNYDMLINVWGSDHHGYVKRLKILCETMGYPMSKIQIPLMELVKLKNADQKIKMSKRKGNVFWWRDLFSLIGKDASFFFLLNNSKKTSIEIDINEARKQTKENLLYYCQYVYARSCQLLAKYIKPVSIETHEQHNFTDSEKELLKTFEEFEDVLEQSIKELDPVFLVRYAIKLAKSFHNFYSLNRVFNDNKAIENLRIKIVQKTQNFMKTILNLLSVSHPSVM